MILNLGSLAFNANLSSGGGTPAWGTELGQGEGYKFSFEDMSDFFTGMVYTSVPDIDKITCPLGKGGNQQKDYEFVIASLFTKVFVNGKRINSAKFLLLIVKKIKGEYHVGRRTIKYNPKITYRGEFINQDCFNRIPTVLGIPEDSSWFVHEININNQDELHFSVYVLGESPKTYSSIEERKKDFISRLPKTGTYDVSHRLIHETETDKTLQQIFYGAPGTGKSHRIKELTEGCENIIRTTFHPDSDYSTFVGAYKPTMKENVIINNGVETKEEQIVYRFVPQVFTKAYIAAWNTEEDVYLVIEEINRGNCAQIFGDLFQLLDRKDGMSEYPVDADSDLADHIRKGLEDSPRTDFPEGVKEGIKLQLPSNLYIWATMNTSDQSLFPIDSASKRRWEWKYMKIKDHPEKDYKIKLADETYGWYAFIEKINEIIASMTSSADKQLGYFFCKADNEGNIDAETFVAKVIFYLWNDVFKDYGFEDTSLFRYKDEEDGQEKDLTFPDFYDEEGEKVNETRLKGFLESVMNWKKKSEENG